MSQLALLLAVGAMIAAAVPAPGLFVAIGLGIAAIGAGWVGYRRARGKKLVRAARRA